jgi:hypothetical protein
MAMVARCAATTLATIVVMFAEEASDLLTVAIPQAAAACSEPKTAPSLRLERWKHQAVHRNDDHHDSAAGCDRPPRQVLDDLIWRSRSGRRDPKGLAWEEGAISGVLTFVLGWSWRSTERTLPDARQSETVSVANTCHRTCGLERPTRLNHHKAVGSGAQLMM